MSVTRTDNLGTGVAWGRDDTSLGVAGVSGSTNWSGVQNQRQLDVAPVNQPTNAAGAGIAFNQVMTKYAENFDPFIQQTSIEQPRFWHDRIPRSAYQLFSGATKETRIFRGGLVHYAGLGHWGDIADYALTETGGTGAGGSINGKVYPKTHSDPVTYGYSWEKLQWSGKEMAWASDPIHQDIFRFTQQAQTQLAWILQAGVEFGISHLEVWNRDNYIHAAVQNGRAYLMSSGGDSMAVENQFYYNPYSYGSAPLLSDKPHVVFPVDKEVEPLNFDALDFAHDALSVRAPTGGIGSESGKPIFGLPISLRDFEKYVKGNPAELATWREAFPQELIKGYGMLLKMYRYYSLIEDTNQLRFKIAKVVTVVQAKAAGIHTFDSLGNAAKLFVAEYVPPRRLERSSATSMGVPAENPDYIKADLAISPIVMNNVFINQFVPATPQLGSGTSFGAVPGLNGQWGWLNVPDKITNPFNKVGNFYGVYEIYPKPEGNFVNATAYLYRRCNETLRARCPVNVDVDTGSDATIVSCNVTTEAEGETITDKAFRFKLANTIDATIGTTVSVAIKDKNNAAGVIYGVVTGVSDAAEYLITITDTNSKLGSGTGSGADGTYWVATNFVGKVSVI